MAYSNRSRTVAGLPPMTYPWSSISFQLSLLRDWAGRSPTWGRKPARNVAAVRYPGGHNIHAQPRRPSPPPRLTGGNQNDTDWARGRAPHTVSKNLATPWHPG